MSADRLAFLLTHALKQRQHAQQIVIRLMPPLKNRTCEKVIAIQKRREKSLINKGEFENLLAGRAAFISISFSIFFVLIRLSFIIGVCSE